MLGFEIKIFEFYFVNLLFALNLDFTSDEFSAGESVRDFFSKYKFYVRIAFIYMNM